MATFGCPVAGCQGDCGGGVTVAGLGGCAPTDADAVAGGVGLDGAQMAGRATGEAAGSTPPFSSEADSVLIPSRPFRRLVFADYLDRGTHHKLFKGEAFAAMCRQPDDPYLHYLESGRIEIAFRHDDGTRMRLFERGAGNAFQSEFAGIASQGASRLSFSALENSVITSFTYAQVQRFVAEDPQAFADLVYINHITFGQLSHQLDNVSAQSTSRRMLVWLKKLADTNEPDAEGRHHIACDMTVQEMSDMLMIHTTTCSRLLSALKRQGIVHRSRHELVIDDPAALERLCFEENPLLY